MKKNNPLKPLAIASSAILGAGALAYHEIMGRNAKLMNKIAEASGICPDEDETTNDNIKWLNNTELEHFTIMNDRGQILSAWYLPADEETDKYILCAHGYRSDGRSEFKYIAKRLHDLGFNLFLVDHQSAGESDGDYISFGYYESQDLLTWIDYMREKFGEDISLILYGISMGAASVDIISNNEKILPNTKFIISDCAYTSVYDQFGNILKGGHLPSGPIMGLVNVINKTVQKFDLKEASPIEHILEAKVPVLFIHGSKDDFVKTPMCKELYDRCPTEKDLLIVEGADHAMSYRTNSEEYEKKILEFCEKYL